MENNCIRAVIGKLSMTVKFSVLSGFFEIYGEEQEEEVQYFYWVLSLTYISS